MRQTVQFNGKFFVFNHFLDCFRNLAAKMDGVPCNIKFKFVNLTEKDTGKIFSWSEVGEIHRTRRGIYQKNEQIISLLTDFGKINPCYPDTENETADKIFYTGAGRRGDQKLDVHNRALLNAVETRVKVPLFCKMSVGRWEFLGFWQIVEGKYIFDEQNERMVWKFALEKIKNFQKTD